MSIVRGRLASIALPVAFLLTQAVPGYAQIRGLYAPGTTAISSGVLPAPGLTYQALFQPYSFDETKAPDGRHLPGGSAR
jgi:hypothetical protein